MPPVAAASLSADAGAGAAIPRQTPVLWRPPEEGASSVGCPQAECKACEFAATAASTSQQGNKAVLTHMAIHATTNHRPQRFAERVDIRRIGCPFE